MLIESRKKTVQLNHRVYKDIIDNTVDKVEQNLSNLNNLNIFPVPDGDTGTNILLTLRSGQAAINKHRSESVGELSEVFSKALLFNSKGNSGVILSQYFRGFHSRIGDHDIITAETLFDCFNTAYKEAYGSLSNPQEGTIITVMRATADFRNSNDTSLKTLYEISCQTVINSMSQMDMLKEAGVIDSGAYAFLFFIESIYYHLSNDDDKTKHAIIQKWKSVIEKYTPEYSLQFRNWKNQIENSPSKQEVILHDQLHFRYCTEFLLSSDNTNLDLRSELDSMGDSLLIAHEGNDYKIHIHTNEAEKAITRISKLGKVYQIKIDDMAIQHDHFFHSPDESSQTEKLKKSSLLSIAYSESFSEIMLSLGADQTIVPKVLGKPSLEEILSSLSSLPAQDVIFLINDESMFSYAKEICNLSFKTVHLVQTKSIPEGISAILSYQGNESLKENLLCMEEAVQQVKSVKIFRDNDINYDTETGKEQFVAHYQNEVISSDRSHSSVLTDCINQLIQESISLITIYFGDCHSTEDIEQLKINITDNYKNIELEFIPGDHPTYHYVLSAE